MAQASMGYIAVSVESTPGTAITTPTNFIPLEETDFMFENEFTDINEIAGSRQAYRSFDGPYRPSATMKGAFYPAGCAGVLLKALTGAHSSALVSPSVTARKHSFTDGALPYLTLERSDATSGAGGILCERLAGSKVEKISINAAYGEKVDFSVDFKAMKKPTTGTAVAAGSIVYPSMEPLIFKGASVKVDAVANSFFKSLNLEFTNVLTPQEALRGTQEAYKIFEGGFQCSVSGTLVFEDLSFYNKLLNGTEFALQLIMNSDTFADAPNTIPYSLTLTWAKTRVQKHSTPFKAGDVLEADVTFKIKYDLVAKRSVQIDMVNLDINTAYDA